MKGYQTEQKRMLLAFLQNGSALPMTIEQIAEGLARQGGPGKSTVYRLMNQLVEEGAVRRFVRGNSRHFVYQLMPERCMAHLHCRCVACGRLYHLDETLSQSMSQQLASLGFALDAGKTMLVGTCSSCGGQ